MVGGPVQGRTCYTIYFCIMPIDRGKNKDCQSENKQRLFMENFLYQGYHHLPLVRLRGREWGKRYCEKGGFGVLGLEEANQRLGVLHAGFGKHICHSLTGSEVKVGAQMRTADRLSSNS